MQSSVPSTQLRIDLGSLTLSEAEIIEFAKRFDPLPFHTDLEAAQASIFEGLVASGPHLFNAYYQKRFLPLYQNSILAGMEMKHWRFILPVYANQETYAHLSVLSVEPNKQKDRYRVLWFFEFFNSNHELVQSLELLVLHKFS